MVNKKDSSVSANMLRFLLWILILVIVSVIAVLMGLLFSGDGEIQAPGAERGSIIEIV